LLGILFTLNSFVNPLPLTFHFRGRQTKETKGLQTYCNRIVTYAKNISKLLTQLNRKFGMDVLNKKYLTQFWTL
jgi:hypothetical protein